MTLYKKICLSSTLATIIISTAIVMICRYTVIQEIQKITRQDLTDMVNISVGFLELNPDINKSQFEQFINKKLSLGTTGFMMVVNSKGEMVVHRKVQGKNWSKKPFINKIITEKNGYHRFISPKTGTWKIAAYKYFPTKDWIIVATNFEDDALKTPIANITKHAFISIIPLLLGYVFFIIVFTKRHFIKPLNIAVQFANQIAKGDVSKEILVKNSDEIGILTQSLADMRNNLYTMISEINASITTLKLSATDMSAVSNQFTTTLETTAVKSNTVAAAAEEMSSNSHSVAAGVEQASINTSTIVTNVRDISESLAEMVNSAQQVKEETSSAVAKVEFSSGQVDKLGQASQEIGSITETIRAISDKTNLLALNATIEAARAGDAGKGFAVVANEIKELAKQTANATDNINQKLNLTQELTTITVNEIEGITNTINRIDNSVGIITNSIHLQNESTSDISDSINQTAQGLQKVNENVSQLSIAADQVAKEITEVNELNSQMTHSSTQVQQDAGKLNELSSQLKKMVQKFTL